MAGVRVRPALPLVLFALLAGSAVLAFWAQRAGEASPALTAAAPWLFATFALGFAVYRISLVLARRYRLGKALVQIGLAALFAGLLFSPGLRTGALPLGRPVGSLAQALGDHDPWVRALAAEVAGARSDVTQAPALVGLLSDRSKEVRAAAHASLVKLNGGVDLGPPETAAAAWKERFP